MVLVAAWLIRAQIERAALCLTILPARAGVVFIDAPGWRNDLLVDCGDLATAESLVKPFLRSQGVNQMAGLLLSHGDVAHVGGTELISSRFRIAKILTGPARSRSPALRQLLARLEKDPAHWQRVQRGDRLGPWTVLHPAAEDRFTQASNNVVVMRGNLFGTSVLLVSDLGRLGQRKLLEREVELHADILVAGLSNNEFVTEALLDAVKPRLLIVASAEYPTANRPSRQLHDRLAQRKIPVVYTSEAGAAILSFRPAGWQVRTMDGRQAQAETLAPYLPNIPPFEHDDGADETDPEAHG